MTLRIPARLIPIPTRSGPMGDENDENTVLEEELEDDSF